MIIIDKIMYVYTIYYYIFIYVQYALYCMYIYIKHKFIQLENYNTCS